MPVAVTSVGSPSVSFDLRKDAPQPNKTEPWVPKPTQSAVKNFWTALSLNADGLRHWSFQVTYRHNRFKAPIMEAFEALVKAPVSNSTQPQPTAFRRAHKALKQRFEQMPSSARAVEIEFKGVPDSSRPTLVQLANQMFVAAGMGELTAFRDTTNADPMKV